MKKYFTLILCAGLLLLAGLANGVMDTLQFHYSASIFPQGEGETLLGQPRQFWDPAISWQNKYADWPTDTRPRFPLAKTALVFLTDGWHLAQFIMLTAFTLACLIPLARLYPFGRWIVVAFGLAKLLFSIGFWVMYYWVLVRRRGGK